MAATFACPHCAASYPVKPVLVGRAVRCTACKKPFRLREDGIADPLGDAPAAPEPAPAVRAPAAPEPAHAVQAPAPPPPGPAVRPTPAPAAQPSTERRSQRLRAAASGAGEDLRRSMAATLTTALGDAIKAEERKPQSERIAKASGPAQKAIGPAILTGEGERAAAESRRWWLGLAAAALLVGGLAWLVLRPAPAEVVLARFTAAAERAEMDAAGGRIPAIQRRGWVLPDPAGLHIDPFVELRGLRLGAPGTAVVGPALAPLAGKAWFAPAELWVDAARLDEAAAAWLARPEAKALLARTALAAVDHRGVRSALAVLGDARVRLVEGLLFQPPVPGRASLAAALGAGRIPDRIEVIDLAGDDGWLLVSAGSGHKTSQGIAYHGALVRIPELDPEWRVAELRAGEAPVE